MSKMDGLRAMREARYAEATARAAKPKKAAAKPVATAPSKTASPKSVTESGTESETQSSGLCGHRSMNGRTCTRESGHSAKSHRYS